MKETKAKSSFGGYFLWIMFPPYGIYKLFRSKVRWYIKVPIILILALFITLAVDQSLKPHRVEDMEAKKLIASYLTDVDPEEDMGELRKVDRIGAFLWNEKTKIVYRTLTKNGLYNFVLESSGNDNYDIDSIYEAYPITRWIKESKEEYPALPMAMVYFQDNIETFGVIQEDVSDEETYSIKSEKGVFKYNIANNGVTSVQTETGEFILDDQILLPIKVRNYFEKNEEELGKEPEVVGYEFNDSGESFFIQTEKSYYRVDVMDNGDIDLLEASSE